MIQTFYRKKTKQHKIKIKTKQHKTQKNKTQKNKIIRRKSRRSNKRREFNGGYQYLLQPFDSYMRGEPVTKTDLKQAIESIKECDIGDLIETETYDRIPVGLYMLQDYLENYDQLLETDKEIEYLFLDYATEIINRLTEEGYSYLLSEVDNSARNILMLACKERIFLDIALKLAKTKQFDLGQVDSSGHSCLYYLSIFFNETGTLIIHSELFKLFIKYYLEHDANNRIFIRLVKDICSKTVLKRVYSHEIECELFPIESTQVELPQAMFPPIVPASPHQEKEEEEEKDMNNDRPSSVASIVEPIEEGELIRDPMEFNVSDPDEAGILQQKRRFP